MVRTISAYYTSYINFNIPKNIPLMKYEDENNKDGIAWSWYIKWGTIHYFDADGIEKEIEMDNECNDDIKHATPDYDEDDGKEYEESE